MTSRPKPVEQVVKFLEHTLELTPEAYLSDEKWVVRVSNERVETTATFSRSRTNRAWKQRGATLTIDGEPVPLAGSPDELADIFRDPENQDSTPQQPQELMDVPPHDSVDQAPWIVRLAHGKLASRGQPVVAGRVGSEWRIGVDTERSALRISFVREGGKAWKPGPVQIVVDGVDRSQEAAGDVDKAMRLAMGSSGPEQGGTPGKGQGRTAQPARQNSVETRRNTVFRV